MSGIGGGLAALAFWGFVAAVVVAGIWYGVREMEAKHETFRRVVESGQPADQALLDSVFGGDRMVDRDLKIAGFITLSAAPGLAMLGWFVSFGAPQALMPLLGIASLAGFVGIGLLIASKVAERASRQGDPNTLSRNMAP